MKKSWIIGIFLITLLIFIIGFYIGIFKITGNVVAGPGGMPSFGPSATDQACMMSCMKCSSPGVGCTGNQQECQTKCNVKKPEQTSEEKCVETCSIKGCGEYDFSCQEKNREICDKECGMVKEPEAKNKEEQCIRDCVKKEDSNLICKPGEGGEKGNEICQRCAKSCEHLYEGPCLDELKLETKKKECETCEHCYGSPVMGDSGEGYECIVNIECKDASSEFGDEPGNGPGVLRDTGGVVGNMFESIGNFFKGLFGGEKESSENKPISSEEG